MPRRSRPRGVTSDRGIPRCGATVALPCERHYLIHQGFLQAIRGGGAPCSNFADYAGPFTDMMYVGFLAMKAPLGKKVEWDGAAIRSTNLPELNRFARREYRKGWEL